MLSGNGTYLRPTTIVFSRSKEYTTESSDRRAFRDLRGLHRAGGLNHDGALRIPERADGHAIGRQAVFVALGSAGKRSAIDQPVRVETGVTMRSAVRQPAPNRGPKW
jgi:hypothetical protein